MSPRLLVVDDSLTVRKLVELAFKGSDAIVEFAVSGADGLAAAARGAPPQAILLDVVLPDMRGTEVCRRLSQEPRLAQIPVVMMSANDLSVREHFAAFPSVVDFVAKPFSRGEIARRLRQACAGGPGSSRAPEAEPAPVREPFSFEQKQAAARLLFGHLKARLAQIPSWTQQAGEAPTASYYARKILTPELMERLLGDLLPLALEAAAAAPEGANRLLGQLSGPLLLDLLRMLESGRRTGVMRLQQQGLRLIAWWKNGAVQLASSFDPGEYQRESTLSLEGVAADARARAEEEQRLTGKPLYASLAQAGQLSQADARLALWQQGLRLLRRALREPGARLDFRAQGPVPPFVDSLGQPIPVAQMWLERLRAVAEWAEVERAVPSVRAVFERGERFSAKLRPLQLIESERRILALVDGRAAVQELVERSGLDSREAFHVLYRLAEVGLLRRRESPLPRPKVLILEPDADGVRRPLAALLAGRTRRAELVALEPPHQGTAGGAAFGRSIRLEPRSDPVAAILSERPALVLLNVTATGAEEAARIAQALSAHPDCASALVALLEPDAEGCELAEGALFDAVLVKPVHLSEIERLVP